MPQLDKYIFLYEIKNLSIIFFLIYSFIRHTVIIKISFLLKFKKKKEKEINWLFNFWNKQLIGSILWLYKKNYILFDGVNQNNIIHFEKYKQFIKLHILNIYNIYNFFKLYNDNYLLDHYYNFDICQKIIMYISIIKNYVISELYSLEPFYIFKSLDLKLKKYVYMFSRSYINREYLGVKIIGLFRQFKFFKNFFFFKNISYSEIFNKNFNINKELIRLC